jgi:glycosyltransferase involved in cell wall biosynthesis
VAKNLQKKIAAVSQIPRLKVVAPSPWMVDLAQSSSVFRNTPVELIPNPIRDEFLETITPGDPPSQGLFFTVVATDLSDPLKNIPFLLSAFREFRKTHDAVSLHLVGSKGQKFSQEDGVIYRGALDSRSLRHQLESSIALLVPSVAENAPLVIAEAAALGIPAVVNEVDSLVGMVSWVGCGRAPRTPAQWSEALGSLVQELPKNLHRSTANRLEKIARELFDPKVVARQYVKLYESMQ